MGVALAIEDPWEGIDKEDFKVVKKSKTEFAFLADQRAGAEALLVNRQKPPAGKISAALAGHQGSTN